jgi:transcriptional regulator with XRE-family HTH domain
MAATRASTFGDLLRRYRLAATLTQEQLAETAGLSARGISDVERGLKLRPRRDTMTLLVDALQLAPPQRALLAGAARDPSVSRAQLADASQEWASYLDVWAAQAVTQGQARLAAQIWGAAEGVRETSGIVPWPESRAVIAGYQETARDQPSESAFEATWAQGRPMSLEQALAATRTARTPA